MLSSPAETVQSKPPPALTHSTTPGKGIRLSIDNISPSDVQNAVFTLVGPDDFNLLMITVSWERLPEEYQMQFDVDRQYLFRSL
jgi:hypothetical protein